MTFDDELQELHCDSLCDPQCWQEKADHLKQVSSLLRPKVQEYWSAPIDNRDDKEHFVSMRLMICACAIENLLKGILIAENQEEVKIRNPQYGPTAQTLCHSQSAASGEDGERSIRPRRKHRIT